MFERYEYFYASLSCAVLIRRGLYGLQQTDNRRFLALRKLKLVRIFHKSKNNVFGNILACCGSSSRFSSGANIEQNR